MHFSSAILALIVVVAGSSLRAQAPAGSSASIPAVPSFEQKLREVRADLQVGRDGFSGNAAPLLNQAIADSRYVLIGEDHLTHEIPQFAAAVSDLMAKEGPLTLVAETGPQVARFVGDSLGRPDRVERMAALQKRFPDCVAFLNATEENDLVEHAAHAAGNHRFQFWGLDQEFEGSAGWLLEQIQATHPGPAATDALARLQAEERRDAAQAQESGDSRQLFLFVASDADLSAAGALLQREGSPEANTLFRGLVESHQIYLKYVQGSPDSNAQRARLLKNNLRRHLEAATTGPEGKVLVKFGDWHLYKGFNPLHQRDLGNWIAEWADGHSESSLHLCVLGAKGTHLLYGGYGRPLKTEPFVMDEDPDYRWLKPAMDNQLPDAWTVYDLRRLRLQNLGTVDPDMRRLIDGYDLLVIIPEVTPATPIR